jgi:hypothetical protein
MRRGAPGRLRPNSATRKTRTMNEGSLLPDTEDVQRSRAIRHRAAGLSRGDREGHAADAARRRASRGKGPPRKKRSPILESRKGNRTGLRRFRPEAGPVPLLQTPAKLVRARRGGRPAAVFAVIAAASYYLASDPPGTNSAYDSWSRWWSGPADTSEFLNIRIERIPAMATPPATNPSLLFACLSRRRPLRRHMYPPMPSRRVSAPASRPVARCR